MLHGRDTGNLQSVAQYGTNRLRPFAWSVLSTTDLVEALGDARIVLHQIRYGGLEGREHDERVALQCDTPPDETLGPGALHSILRTVPELRNMGSLLAEVCPDAWVLNLTNPLSMATSVLLEAGMKRCAGLCELPLVTARDAAAFLKIPFEELEWAYTGLNHRGFLTPLKSKGEDCIEQLAERLGRCTLGGITSDQIAELHALPTKYFQVICGRERPSGGRAAFLAQLRKEVAEDLFRDPFTPPRGLSKRYLEWYPQAVVPMIVALFSEQPSLQMVNAGLAGGVQWRSVRRASPLPPSNCCPHRRFRPMRYGRWLGIYRRHEEAMLRCIREPSLSTIADALWAVSGST